MKILCRLIVILLLAAVVGCGKQPPPEKEPFRLDTTAVDGERALSEVQQLIDLGLRDSGTEGTEKAAEHLKSRLEAVGVTAEIDAFKDISPKGEIVFRNVIGRLEGEGPGIIILGSHYDTKSDMPDGFEGANDSGSSSGLLVELARVLAQQPRLARTVWFVFFDGEESMTRYGPRDGFHGSRHMADQLVESRQADEVLAFILMDMVGDKDLTVTIPRNGEPGLVSLIFDAARAEGVRDKFTLFPYEIGDDHEAFLAIDIPAVDLIDFEYGSAPRRNDYWHTAEDTMDKLSPESLEIVGRVVLRAIEALMQP